MFSVEAVTTKLNENVPVSPSGSVVVPLTLWDPTAKVPLVVTIPLDDTNKLVVPLVFV